jgi:hypothetical protein
MANVPLASASQLLSIVGRVTKHLFAALTIVPSCLESDFVSNGRNTRRIVVMFATLRCKDEWQQTKPEPKGRASETETVSVIDDDFDDVGSLLRIAREYFQAA